MIFPLLFLNCQAVKQTGLPAHSLSERTDSPVCMSEAYILYFHSVNGYKYPASNAAYSDSISCYITDIAANTEVLI